MRICIIASSRFPVIEPFAGGLEAHTYALVEALTRKGHNVSLFAAPGSDKKLNFHPLEIREFTMSDSSRKDVGAPPDWWMQEHHAYMTLMLDLAVNGSKHFDVIHNNSFHHLPVAMSRLVDAPIVTTLHTPPTPWLESAMSIVHSNMAFVSVSHHTARLWSSSVPSEVILNGIDCGKWIPGPGGGSPIWFGRIVPEKGLHYAVQAACEARVSLDIAGPLIDQNYFTTSIAPLLGGGIRYLGHLTHDELVTAVGAASVSVVSPCWDEPYGLVLAESLACGTPVAAFDRGATSEILDPLSGRLAKPDNVLSLSQAIRDASRLNREDVRARAEMFCSHERMVEKYESVYHRLHRAWLAA